MIKRIILVGLFSASVAVLAQDASKAKPTTVCVAQLRNQAITKFDLAKLRQALLDSLQSTKLAKDGAIILVPIAADNSDDAKSESEKSGCAFAIYTRVLQKPKDKSVGGAFDGTNYEISKTDKTPLETYGLQCTVERTSSGMPILLDRQFDSQPSREDKGVLKLLGAESARIEEALGKKLAN